MSRADPSMPVANCEWEFSDAHPQEAEPTPTFAPNSLASSLSHNAVMMYACSDEPRSHTQRTWRGWSYISPLPREQILDDKIVFKRGVGPNGTGKARSAIQ